VRLFAENPDVSFADVNLSDGSKSLRGSPQSSVYLEEQLSGSDPDHPWPLIRYYNAETGMEGATYISKTTMALCYELGIKNFFMLDFIQEAANTSLCYTDGKNCDARSLRYLNTFKDEQGGDVVAWQAQLDQLQQEIDNGSHDPWVWRRQRMILALIQEDVAPAEEL
jgi:hypothetical protein